MKKGCGVLRCVHTYPQAVNDAAANPQSESMPVIGMGAEFPQLMEVAERLNENVAQLHRSICLFMGQAWKKARLSAHPTSEQLSLPAQLELSAALEGLQELCQED